MKRAFSQTISNDSPVSDEVIRAHYLEVYCRLQRFVDFCKENHATMSQHRVTGQIITTLMSELRSIDSRVPLSLTKRWKEDFIATLIAQSENDTAKEPIKPDLAP